MYTTFSPLGGARRGIAPADDRSAYRRACPDNNRENKCQIQLQESPTGRLFHPMCNCNCLRMRKYDALKRLREG